MKIKTRLMCNGLSVTLLISMLSGCSVFSPIKSDNYTTYVLNGMPSIKRESRNSGTLYVSPVVADPLYNTNEMAYSTNQYQVEYFAKNRWADDPAKMLRPLILRTLENTHHFHAVTGTPGPVRYDYILNIRLVELRQIFLSHSSYVVLNLHAEIVNTRTGHIISSKNITTEQPARCNDPSSGVVAANTAVAQALEKLTYFCLRNT